jgi:hypothetical protein
MILGAIGWRFSNKNRANCRNGAVFRDSAAGSLLAKRNPPVG